jgi:hypothetical protein
MRRLGALLFAVAVLGGCYHATIETGLAPGSTTIQEDWAMSFVYGLVPPPTMDAMGQWWLRWRRSTRSSTVWWRRSLSESSPP